MKRVILPLGDKGGSGKSTALRALVECLQADGRRPMLLECDPTVGHLMTFFGKREASGKLLSPQPADGVRQFSLHGSERDRTEFGAILDEGHELIIGDLPAASVTLLTQVERDYGFFALAHELGYAVTLLCVITPDSASAAAVRGAIELDPLADVVAIKNLAFGDEQDFIVWAGSEREGIPEARGRQMLRDRGGRDITMPKLNAGTVALIGAHKLTFTAAAGNGSPIILPRRSQTSRWLSNMRAEFERVGEVLSFSPPPARSKVSVR
jgi:hypothetical protein